MNPFTALVEAQGFVLFDGGLATELERKGADLSGPLWSGRLLRDDPGQIVQVHVEALEAGADVISSASYQVSAGDDLRLSVKLARDACARAGKPRALVAASLGPYGATLADGSEYRGDYALTPRELAAFHGPRVDAVLEAKPDLVLFETLPSLAEAEAVAQLAAGRPGTPFMASFSALNAKGIAHGEPFAEVVRVLERVPNVIAAGINCAPPDIVARLLETVRPARVLLSAQPNSGESWDAAGRRWTGAQEGQGLGDWAMKYRAAGARIFGGCCRTTPADIASVRRALSAR
jgi:homocysteine S-methyltransferase